ncbi:hypothetical protein DCC62_16555 [candidate division KSB1 bacterium]|nr:MAG: hypothetical protein DCC62_16555 [candidate division KSB1 bacterium]
MTFGMSVCTTPSITFSPGTHAGNLFAGDDILISSKNTIIGNTNLTCDSLINPDYTPPSKEMVVLGIQHVLAMFAGNVAVPIIVAEVARLTNAGKIFLIQAAMRAAGPTSTLP